MASGHCFVVDSGGVPVKVPELIESVTAEPLDISFTDYETLSEELYVMNLTKKDFAKVAGYSPSTVYSWNRHGVPKTAVKFMEMKLAFEDKVNPEKGTRLT